MLSENVCREADNIDNHDRRTGMTHDIHIDDHNRDDDWALDQVEIHEPPKNPRAVVSVAFPRDDFEKVSDAASASNMKVSEFIRTAALERAERVTGNSRSYSVSTSGSGALHHTFTAAAPTRRDVHQPT
jgi:hypothetical protein